MSEWVQGCCNDLACGTGGEPLTYDCTEVYGDSLVVENCGVLERCPGSKPYCCRKGCRFGEMVVCADHRLEDWSCIIYD
jgi:hypothetical protein